MRFEVRSFRLPHDGIIPGARGHKKIVPKGTEVFCIVYENKVSPINIFWCAYLNRGTAEEVANNLEATSTPGSKRHIAFDTLLAWNFKQVIPVRIHCEKGK